VGITSLKESLLKSKIFWLVLSLLLTGVGMKILSPPNKLDIRFWYSVEEAKSFLVGLSPDQSRLYFYGEILDFWFMINYSWILHLIFKKKFVLITGGVDFFETSLIVLFLITNEFISVMNLLPILSSLKWTTALLMISLVILHLVKRVRQ